MSIRILLRKKVGDTLVRYLLDETVGTVELNLFPAESAEPPVPEGEDAELVPLAFVRFSGDSAGVGFGAGRSMRYSGTVRKFRFESQTDGSGAIRTVLVHESGCRLIHLLRWENSLPVFRCDVSLENSSGETIGVELLESFTLGGILGNEPDETFSRMKLHRFRSRWCSEAYHECVEAPAWQLERDPGRYVVQSERYGQAGTLPVRGFHPFGAAEDSVNGICWGAQLAWSGSWQMEFSLRRSPGLAFGGGLADYEFGHWRKFLKPGETLQAPAAFLCCLKGTFDALCARLVRGIENTLAIPEAENDLPVIFNEWCTSWGEPSAESLGAIAEKLRELPVSYLVIDAGWYKKDGAEWSSGQGDWCVNERLFPRGIDEAIAKIRDCGLIPGIWFEAEVAGESSRAFDADAEHMLRDRGRVITAGTRRFWNLSDPAAREILETRVVRFLRDHHFGYVKIDYNETVGVGCDHPDSPGEGLRNQVLGTHWLFRRLAERNPGLVIENCASGGHRLEPAMLALSAMSSFSDAHERDTIPIIAASLHRLIPPRQNQIWAVMRKEAGLKRIAYLLSSAMLGRICLSGDILDLSPQQWELIRNGLEFYRKIVPVLKDGDSVFLPQSTPSRSCPAGGQLLVRVSRDGGSMVLYFHVFADPPELMEYPLPPGGWRVKAQFQAEKTGVLERSGRRVVLRAPSAFSGHVIFMQTEEE